MPDMDLELRLTILPLLKWLRQVTDPKDLKEKTSKLANIFEQAHRNYVMQKCRWALLARLKTKTELMPKWPFQSHCLYSGQLANI